MAQHFLRLQDFSKQTLNEIITNAITSFGSHFNLPAKGKVLALLFEKSSTRTRLSFQTGFAHLGGTSIFLSSSETQINRGETVADSARVMSGMADIIVVRTDSHVRLTEFAKHARCPVINGLSDTFHPCQLLADIMTFMQLRGDITGKRVAFVGDASNNMCASYIEAADIFDFSIHVACPQKFAPLITSSRLRVFDDPQEAVLGADLIVTDVWVSMGDEPTKIQHTKQMQSYQVTAKLLDLAENPLFLHCLPAHRGEEVDDFVLDDPRSGVWQASDNRLHAQKALLAYILHNLL